MPATPTLLVPGAHCAICPVMPGIWLQASAIQVRLMPVCQCDPRMGGKSLSIWLAHVLSGHPKSAITMSGIACSEQAGGTQNPGHPARYSGRAARQRGNPGQLPPSSGPQPQGLLSDRELGLPTGLAVKIEKWELVLCLGTTGSGPGANAAGALKPGGSGGAKTGFSQRAP